MIPERATLARAGGGPEDRFLLEPTEFAALGRDARTAWEAIEPVDYGRKSSERANMKFRRSLCAVREIAEGKALSVDNIRSIRPGFGLAPRDQDKVIGRQARKPIARVTPLSWDLLV
jgi:N-acetylneuraminate synthase